MEKVDYRVLASKLICIAFLIAVIYFVFEYALGILLPFVVAFCIGAPINRLSSKVAKVLRVPKKLCAALFIIITFCVVVALICLGLNRFLLELRELLERSDRETSEISNIIESVVQYVEALSSKLPFVDEITRIEGLENFKTMIDNGISGILGEMVDNLTSAIPVMAFDAIKKAPKLLITLAVSIIACYYFATDNDRIREGIYKMLSKKGCSFLQRGTKVLGRAVKSYAKAYLLLMLITFLEVFVGLLILKKRYAFIVAVIVAVVDVLPLFGTGVILVPWSVISFVIGDGHTGVGLLILYGVITIIRQLTEPKIVGETLGVHPLATLFSMFIGLSLFGFFGMILGPCAFYVIREWGRGEAALDDRTI